MAHKRLRFLESRLKKSLTWSPVVSVLGMRQVGKSTLVSANSKTYVTLDDEATLTDFLSDHWASIENKTAPVAIDECQKAPKLFDRVKLLVDRRKRPGTFILTGSVRFLSQRQIRESLTGRTAIMELLPLTISETHGQVLYDLVSELIRFPDHTRFIERRSKSHWITQNQASTYLDVGGLPGICFKRERKVRDDLYRVQIETLLSRDIQFLYAHRLPVQRLISLCEEIATLQGDPINQAALARIVSVSSPTVSKLLHAMEGLCLLRNLGSTWYLADQGLATYLLQGRGKTRPRFDIRRWVFQEIFSQLNYLHPNDFKITRIITPGNLEIPFRIQMRSGHEIAILVDEFEAATERSLRSAAWIKRRFPNSQIVILHRGNKPEILKNALSLPYTWLA